MLPSFRKRLSVALCADHIAVRSVGRGWRPVATLPLALTAAADGKDAPWRAALAALRAYVDDGDYAGAELDVVLADSFARYALIDWSDQIQTLDEVAALAQIRFDRLYGAAAADWRCRADMREFGRAGIACALDAALLAALDELCASTRLRLVGLRPNFMRAFNEARSRIGDDAVFAVVDGGACVLATRADGAWKSIRTIRLRGPSGADLGAILGREIVLQGLPDDCPIFVEGAAAPDDAGHLSSDNLIVLGNAAQGARAGLAMLGAAR